MLDILVEFFKQTGFAAMTKGEFTMILVALFLLYLAISKGYEPYLLIPISFGMLLANLPLAGLMGKGGFLELLYKGVEYGIFPPLIFLGVGASTDFGPLISNPKSLILGAAAQFGIFFAFLGAILLGFNVLEASSIGIIGGADGPTALYLTSLLAPDLLGPIAVAAYSYMALVPVIQPPIINMLTTKEERKIKMVQLREVSKKEKILFPIIVTILVSLIVPSAAPLIGMLMFGNLVKEVGTVGKLVETSTNSLMYTVTIFLGLTVGATANAKTFLNPQTLGIIALGLVAFAVGTAAGVIVAKIMNVFLKDKINPMIGAAGVSAVPMAARVVQVEGQKNDPSNFNACNGSKCSGCNWFCNFSRLIIKFFWINKVIFSN